MHRNVSIRRRCVVLRRTLGWGRCAWVSAAALLVVPSALGAQAPRRPVRSWSVSIAGGGAVSGTAAPGFEAAMRAGGFDDAAPCSFFCSAPTPPRPFSRGGGGGPLFTIRRRFGNVVHARAVVGRVNLSRTFGYKADQVVGSFVTVTRSVRSYAILVGLNAPSDGGLWVAAGPALQRIALAQTQGSGGPTVSMNRFGAVVASGLVLPARKRFFVELQGQYRLVGTVDVEPMDVLKSDGSLAGTLPRSASDFNHGVALVGVGVRF